MEERKQAICLCMIVKNEAHVLRRCLESARPLIDHWIIVDTGSSDGTQDLICSLLQDIPGQLLERPWKNFGHNRSEAIALARSYAHYLLTLDADEYFEVDIGFRWPDLTLDAYDFAVLSGTVTYARIQLVRSSLPWRYEGVLHEYITCDQPYSQARMTGIWTKRLLEGARSRDPLTYQKDALLLEEALQQDPTNTRHTFYLAQSYRDAGHLDAALKWYRRRSSMGGFEEEVWSSLYEIGRLLELTGSARLVVEQAYLEAFTNRPHRAEPLYRIALYYQRSQEYALAMPFLEHAMEIPFPSNDLLFVEADVYQFLLPLEYAVACYWLGRHHEAIATTDRLLANDSLSSECRTHLLRNRSFSEDALRLESVASDRNRS